MTQTWVWLLVAFAAAGAWATFLLQVVMRLDEEAGPVSDAAAWVIWLMIGLLLPLLMLSVKLTTEVTAASLRCRYFPFARKEIEPAEITHVYIRSYRPVRDYGGWGVRWTPWSGWAYNMNGNRGVQLELAGGKRVLIGSERPEELLQAIELMLGGAR